MAARRTGTYRQRVFFAGLATAAVAILLLSTRATKFTGPMIFHIVAWGGFILAGLEGLRATSDSISLERREGTLGLLLLTDLTGREIVVGKSPRPSCNRSPRSWPCCRRLRCRC